MVHDLQHASAAARAACETGVAVTLRSAPAAAGYLGPQVFAEMIAATRHKWPDADIRGVLDCGDEPGRALAAFRHGITCVRVAVGGDVRARLADIARQRGAELDNDDESALDLLDAADPLSESRNWLLETRN